MCKITIIFSLAFFSILLSEICNDRRSAQFIGSNFCVLKRHFAGLMPFEQKQQLKLLTTTYLTFSVASFCMSFTVPYFLVLFFLIWYSMCLHLHFTLSFPYNKLAYFFFPLRRKLLQLNKTTIHIKQDFSATNNAYCQKRMTLTYAYNFRNYIMISYLHIGNIPHYFNLMPTQFQSFSKSTLN